MARKLNKWRLSNSLVVFIDKKLTWRQHVNHVKHKIAKGLGIMSHLRTQLSRHSMILLYNTLINPYLSYCNIVWGSCCKTLLSSILIQQKRAVRLCTGASYLASSDPLFVQLKILKIYYVNTLQISIFMFTFKCGTLPD